MTRPKAGPAKALMTKLASERRIHAMGQEAPPTEGNVLSNRFDRSSSSPERMPCQPLGMRITLPPLPLEEPDGLEELGLLFTSPEKQKITEVNKHLILPTPNLNPHTNTSNATHTHEEGMKHFYDNLLKKASRQASRLMTRELSTVRFPITNHQHHHTNTNNTNLQIPNKHPNPTQVRAEVDNLRKSVLDGSVKTANNIKVVKQLCNTLQTDFAALQTEITKGGAKAAAQTLADCRKEVSQLVNQLAATETAATEQRKQVLDIYISR